MPRNPGAWLMATGKRRAIDLFRRNRMRDRKHDALEYELAAGGHAPDLDAALDDDIGDDLLRLIFTACHPVLSMEARVALTLRLLGGLTTGDIARAFLVPEPTIAQRIVRAKKTLAAERVPFEVPHGADRTRCGSAACWRSWPRSNRKSRDSSRSWKSTRPDPGRGQTRRATRSCCSTRTAPAGITC